MARVTVEDCMKIVENRFELVVLSSQRAKDISAGAELTVKRDNDKNPVVALREIALKNINIDNLREIVIRNMQKNSPHENTEQETLADNSEEDTNVMEIELFDDVSNLTIEDDLNDDANFSFDGDNLEIED